MCVGLSTKKIKCVCGGVVRNNFSFHPLPEDQEWNSPDVYHSFIMVQPHLDQYLLWKALRVQPWIAWIWGCPDRTACQAV